MYGHIQSIEIVENFRIEPVAPLNGTSGVRLGLAQMINALSGYSGMDGYKVVTDEHTFHVLIDNGQSCCESWGYMSSDDDFTPFIGAELRAVELSDTSRFKENVEELRYLDAGGVQFVDFVTDKGVFQLAVYNGHNGYYGHGILVAKDDEILLNDSL